jgi:arylsulfatase
MIHGSFSFRSNVVCGFVLSLLLLSGCNAPEQKSPASTPNFIIIIADDMGYGDLGYTGNNLINTPTIDAFAEKSTVFRNFYVSPVCAPTRSSLMTGRYSQRTGIYDTYNGGAIMATEEKTIPEYLKAAGYTSGIFGKWHLGDNYPFRPQDQGFDEVLVHGAGGIGQPGDHIDNHRRFHVDSYFSPTLEHNGVAEKSDGYCTDVFTGAAMDFLEKNRKGPFFLYLAFNAPHSPHLVPQEYYDHYADLSFDSLEYAEADMPYVEIPDRIKDEVRKIYGMVENIDDNVARILKKVDELDLAENTHVIFMSDNGPWNIRFTSGLRGNKGTVFEGGIKVPFYWRFPGVNEEGKTIETAAYHLDMLPTILDITGIEPTTEMDGSSLLPLITEEDPEWHERTVFSYWQRGFLSKYQNMAVRSGKYKLVSDNSVTDAEDFELFNIEADPYEATDLSEAEPTLKDSLVHVMDAFLEEIGASPHLSPRYIIAGTEHQNPVTLNRNDMKGIGAKQWVDLNISGYWDITIAEAGTYNVSLEYMQPVPAGEMGLRIGTVEFKDRHRGGESTKLEFSDIHLPAITGHLEAWLMGGGQVYWPLYVTIEKVD